MPSPLGRLYVSDVTTSLQNASVQFEGLQEVAEESTKITGDLAVKAKQAVALVQRGGISEAIESLESDFNEISSVRPNLRCKLDRSIAEVCMNMRP